MKKKTLLGKKLFLKKETIAELTIEQSNGILGGALSTLPTCASQPCMGCTIPQTVTLNCQPPDPNG